MWLAKCVIKTTIWLGLAHLASFVGEDTILGDHSMSIDDMKFLGDDSITPIKVCVQGLGKERDIASCKGRAS